MWPAAVDSSSPFIYFLSCVFLFFSLSFCFSTVDIEKWLIIAQEYNTNECCSTKARRCDSQCRWCRSLFVVSIVLYPLLLFISFHGKEEMPLAGYEWESNKTLWFWVVHCRQHPFLAPIVCVPCCFMLLLLYGKTNRPRTDYRTSKVCPRRSKGMFWWLVPLPLTLLLRLFSLCSGFMFLI